MPPPPMPGSCWRFGGPSRTAFASACMATSRRSRRCRADVRAEMPACVDHVVSGCFHPEHVITRKIRFEDAHEAIGDPTIRVAFVRDGVEERAAIGLAAEPKGGAHGP